MSIIFDPTTKRIILDSTTITADEIYSRWVDWAATSDNIKYGEIIKHVGGVDLGSGLFIPDYIFLCDGWRVRPLEGNHTLIITGNLFVDGGGIPVVQTLGNYNVSVQYTVPVQAQAMATEGGTGSTVSATEIADEVMLRLMNSIINADIKKVNGISVGGVGSENNPWGPA